MKNKPIVIYHDECMDGFTALWCAYKYFQGEIEAFPARNGEGKIPENIEKRDVYIVDYSYPRDILLEIKNKSNYLFVLDHHKTAESELRGLDFCQFDMNRSGAGMAWDFFFPEQQRPWIVNYVEDQDIWKWEFEDSEDICAYLNSQEKTFEIWDRLVNEEALYMPKARQIGKVINNTIKQYCDQVESLGTIGEIDGHIVPIINAPFFASSKLLNQMCSKKLADGSWPKFSVGWYINQYGQVKYSLRSSEDPGTGTAFDVSELAKKYGGGGHQKASAFRIKNIKNSVHNIIKPLKYLE